MKEPALPYPKETGRNRLAPEQARAYIAQHVPQLLVGDHSIAHFLQAADSASFNPEWHASGNIPFDVNICAGTQIRRARFILHPREEHDSRGPEWTLQWQSVPTPTEVVGVHVPNYFASWVGPLKNNGTSKGLYFHSLYAKDIMVYPGGHFSGRIDSSNRKESSLAGDELLKAWSEGTRRMQDFSIDSENNRVGFHYQELEGTQEHLLFEEDIVLPLGVTPEFP